MIIGSALTNALIDVQGGVLNVNGSVSGSGATAYFHSSQQLASLTIGPGGLVVFDSPPPSSVSELFETDSTMAIPAVPEPSATLLGLLGALLWQMRRRTRSRLFHQSEANSATTTFLP